MVIVWHKFTVMCLCFVRHQTQMFSGSLNVYNNGFSLQTLYVQNPSRDTYKLFNYYSNVLENLIIEDSFVYRDINFDKLTNLTMFSCCAAIFTKVKIQEVIKYLTKLKFLKMKDGLNSGITDYAFSGISKSGKLGHSISELRDLQELIIQLDFSNLGETTLSHILKLKRLRKLHIFCKNVTNLYFNGIFKW